MSAGGRKERVRKTSRRHGVVRSAPPLQIRLTDDERSQLENKAAAAGMTMTDFVRGHIGKTAVVNRKDWQQLVYLFSNLTNNLNQLAKYANTYKSSADTALIVFKLAEIEQQARAVLGIDEVAAS